MSKTKLQANAIPWVTVMGHRPIALSILAFDCGGVDGFVFLGGFAEVPIMDTLSHRREYYCGDYMTEDDLLIADEKISTKNVKFFDVTSNRTATAVTGLSNDGKVFNIVNGNYNSVIGEAFVRIIQYDSLGNILKNTTWDITPE